jgi:cytidine deaminase
MTDQDLAGIAIEAIKNAYAPYSQFSVGAAIISDDNHVFTGVNVENASYGLTLCAERNALTSAVTKGVQQFTAIAIATTSTQLVPPCGACLQVLTEFCTSDFRIITTSIASPERIATYTLGELLPNAFHSSLLQNNDQGVIP